MTTLFPSHNENVSSSTIQHHSTNCSLSGKTNNFFDSQNIFHVHSPCHNKIVCSSREVFFSGVCLNKLIAARSVGNHWKKWCDCEIFWSKMTNPEKTWNFWCYHHVEFLHIFKEFFNIQSVNNSTFCLVSFSENSFQLKLKKSDYIFTIDENTSVIKFFEKTFTL